jgi:hypothetical protein
MVIAIFIGMFICFFGIALIVARKRLSGFKALIAISLSMGLVVGFGSYMLISLSEKYSDWSYLERVKPSIEAFLWVFLGCLLLLPLGIRRFRIK